VARLDGVLDKVLAQHRLPAPVEALVAEAALLTAMIGQTIKLRWKLSLQVRGDGPVRMIATDYFAPDEPREPRRGSAPGRASTPSRSIPIGPALPQMGKGYFAILIDQGPGSTPYQGITPLAGGRWPIARRDLFRPVRAAADPVRCRRPGAEPGQAETAGAPAG
jgi:molecular chaperone Hsp33